MTDPILDCYVELEDIGRRIADLKHRLGELIGSGLTSEAHDKIINAVMEADEATTSMGMGPQCFSPGICYDACDEVDQ